MMLLSFCILSFVLIIIMILVMKRKFKKGRPRNSVKAAVVFKNIRGTETGVSSLDYIYDEADTHKALGYSEYLVSFYTAKGDRLEFKVTPDEYSKLQYGDKGYLSFNGERYIGFTKRDNVRL